MHLSLIRDSDHNEICNSHSRSLLVQYTQAWFSIVKTRMRYATRIHVCYSYKTLNLDSRLRPGWDIQRVLTLNIRTIYVSLIRDRDQNETSNAHLRLVFVPYTQAWVVIETWMRYVTRIHA